MTNKYGLRLKTLREERGYTQEELAKLLHTSRSRIAMYEQGNRQPDFEMQETIADFFNVSLDYLFDREWEEYTPPEDTPTFRADIHNKVILTDTEKQIIEKLRSMPDHEREFYTRMILYYDKIKEMRDNT